MTVLIVFDEYKIGDILSVWY